jgi:DNA-binding MarR family transcriptional regulator
MNRLPVLPCMCANLRRASRALTHIYEEALEPTGLRATQFTVLQALVLAGEVTQGQLGWILAMDSTTLTRTLAITNREGWTKKRRGTDRREWRIGLTTQGKTAFERALPLWEGVQARVREELGSSEWKQLLELTYAVTNVAMRQGDSV